MMPGFEIVAPPWTKPHLRMVRGCWSCLSGTPNAIAFGSTPQRAYNQWRYSAWLSARVESLKVAGYG